MNNQEFRKNRVKFLELDKCSGTMEEVESFIAKYNNTKKEWEHKLTQSQDVVNWVTNPERIDRSIQKNLYYLALTIKQLTTPLSIFDVGCYGGYVYDYLKEFVFDNEFQFNYTGMDIRPEAIEGAIELHKDSTNAKFFVEDIFKLKERIKPNQFDLTVCSRVLIHLPNFYEIIENLLHTAPTIFIIAKVGETKCLLRKKINLDTGEEMDYFYRTFSASDIRKLEKIFGIKTTIITENKNNYSSIILEK